MTAAATWVDPLPLSDRLALPELPPDGCLPLTLKLLQLAGSQRALLNFEAARLLYRAARVCSTSSPNEEEAGQLLSNIERYSAAESRMDANEAESILRMTEQFDETPLVHGDVARWPDTVPPPPIRRPHCYAVTASATVGEADCERILGRTAEAAALLAKLRFVDAHRKGPASAAWSRPLKEAWEALAEDVKSGSAAPASEASDDLAAVDGYGEAPRALQTFLLEVWAGIGGDGFGTARIEVLLRCATEMAAAPESPEIVWRSMGPSCAQRPQRTDEEEEEAREADDGGPPEVDDEGQPLPSAWPVDNVICVSALAQQTNNESLLDAAIKCMWSRRPLDALACLRRLDETRGFWESPIGLALPDSPTKDRYKTAKAVSERAAWLFGGGYPDDAFASYTAAARLLEQEWRAEPLEPDPLELWLQVAWRLGTIAEERLGDEALAAVYLSGICEALSEQFDVPEKMPSAIDQGALLRWNTLVRRNAALVSPDAGNLVLLSAHTLIRRARLLIKGGATDPGNHFNEELVRDLRCADKLMPAKRDPLGDYARELLVGLHSRRAEYAKAGKCAGALLEGMVTGKSKSAPVASPLEAQHATRTAALACLDKQIEPAMNLYNRVIAGPKKVSAIVWLRHAGTCIKLGPKRRRDALSSLHQAVELAELHRKTMWIPAEPSADTVDENGSPLAATADSADAATASPPGSPGRSLGKNSARAAIRACVARKEAAVRAGGGKPVDFYAQLDAAKWIEDATSKRGGDEAMGLDTYQLWVARYTLGLLLQQDGVTAQAMTGGFQPLLTAQFDILPDNTRIAALTGMASCLSQLFKRSEALEACDAAVGLGAGGEVLFAKALLHSQLGQVDVAIATLQKLLKAIPDHLRAMLALSTMLAHSDKVSAAIGQANAAREISSDALPVHQAGLLRLRQGLEDGSLSDMQKAIGELQKACEKHGGKGTAIAADAYAWLGLALGFSSSTLDSIRLAEVLVELKSAASADPQSFMPPLVRGLLLRKSSDETTVEGPLDSNVSDESASCFSTAAVRLARIIPEAADECVDAKLRAELFPAPSHAGSRPGSGVGRGGRSGKRPGSARPGSAGSKASSQDDDDEPQPAVSSALGRRVAGQLRTRHCPLSCRALRLQNLTLACPFPLPLDAAHSPAQATLTSVLQHAAKREEALCFVECLHSIATHAHRAGFMSRAASHYDFAVRLAERVVNPARNVGGTHQARAEAAAGWAHLNRGRLVWAVGGDASAAAKGFELATNAFERALELVATKAKELIAGGTQQQTSSDPSSLVGGGTELPTLEDNVRKGLVAAYFNLGAAHEAETMRLTITSPLAATHGGAGRRGGTLGRAGHAGGGGSAPLGGNQHAEQCFVKALSQDPSHTGAHIGLSNMLLRRHKPREALSHVSKEGGITQPLASLNRGVVMQDLDDSPEGLASARKEIESALAWLKPEGGSIIGAFNRAQMQLLMGEWCEPLAALQALSNHPMKRVESAMDAVDGSAEAERAAINAQLEPLLNACRKWQACLGIALNDFRACASLMMPHVPFHEQCVDVIFAAPPEEALPLSAAQHALLDSLIGKTLEREAAGASGGSDDDFDSQAPATELPTQVSASSLRRVMQLQLDGKVQQGDRLLEAALRPLLPPASRALGAVGALLYLWRARSRIAVGKKLEAAEDMNVALAHVGADSREAPPSAMAKLIAEDDERAAADSTAAAVGTLSTMRREAAAASEKAERARVNAAKSAENAAEIAKAEGGVSDKSIAAARAAEVAAAEAAEAAAKAAAYNSPEALNTHKVAAAAAAEIVPRAAWWACGMLCEEGAQLEAEGEPQEALKRYVAACGWQGQHVIAAANAARLLETVENDFVGAAAAFISVVDSTASARRHAIHATEQLLADDDDEDDVVALREAAGCASNIKGELEVMIKMLKSGFAQRPPEEGPPSEVPVAKQQGKLAIAMDDERHRQRVTHERALGMELSSHAAETVRRKRVYEAAKLGGALIGALAANPSRLFDTNDGDLTFMLWGVERSTLRLQAAMSRGAKALDRKKPKEEERPGSVPAGAMRSKALLPEVARAPTRSAELTERLMSWGDDGTQPEDELHTPITDKLINTVANRAQ